MKPLKAVSRIALLREKANLTQLELAQLLDVTENTVANWEKGRSSLAWIDRVIKLCKIFQCPPEDLVEYVRDTRPIKDEAKKLSLQELRKLINTHEPASTASSEELTDSTGVKHEPVYTAPPEETPDSTGVKHE